MGKQLCLKPATYPVAGFLHFRSHFHHPEVTMKKTLMLLFAVAMCAMSFAHAEPPALHPVTLAHVATASEPTAVTSVTGTVNASFTLQARDAADLVGLRAADFAIPDVDVIPAGARTPPAGLTVSLHIASTDRIHADREAKGRSCT